MDSPGIHPAIAARLVKHLPDGSLKEALQELAKAAKPGGQVIWRVKTEASVFSSPAIGPDGTIYVGSWEHQPLCHIHRNRRPGKVAHVRMEQEACSFALSMRPERVFRALW